MNDYAKLMNTIPVPDGLNDRVLDASVPRRRNRPLIPAAVCALLALAMVSVPTLCRPDAPSPPAAAEAAITPLGIAANHALALPLDAEPAEGQYVFVTADLGTFMNEDGSPVLAPVLAGETRETTPALYALTEESRLLDWPVEGCDTVSLSFPYGRRETVNGDVFHAGIDIPGEFGLSITAADGGTVTETGFDPERGNYLVLDHGEGLTTLYGQCREVLVSAGQSVDSGDTIALLGSTGMSTGPHLHFEVRQDGEAQNPVAYFDAEVRDTLKMG